MYKDIITYELAENITIDDLKAIAKQIVNDWMKNQIGFISWEINTNSKGGYTDIVSWKSEKAAKLAEKEMVNITNAAAWYACYKEGTIKSINVASVAVY